MRAHPGRRTATLALALITVAAAAGAVESQNVERRSFDLAPAAGGRTVVVDNVFGPVRVHAGTGDRVEVVIHETFKGHDDDAVARARREVTLEATPTPGRLELVQQGPFRDDHGRRGHGWRPEYEVEWSWDVTVPADAAVEASTVNGGQVVVEGVRGEVSASNVNGDVRLSGLGGHADASTVNGDVEASFDATLAAPARFSTVNGEIDLAFAAGFGAELSFATVHGEVYTDFPSVAGARPASVESDSRGSAHRFRIGRESVVRLGGGGPRLECSTVNGDIVIRER